MLIQLLALMGYIAELPYAVHLTVVCITAYACRIWANGIKTDRDRDMHGRVVLITGALTPIGAELLDQLARRGTQIIALVPTLADPLVQELIPAVRLATKNELIYAEECDLGSITSIREFCARLIQPRPSVDGQGKPEPGRLDAVIMAHEYLPTIHETIMSSDPQNPLDDAARRQRASLATFLLTTLILPSLLRAPSDRDIRFINIVNPLYAAAIPTFQPTSEVTSRVSTYAREGDRSLRSIIFGRHLQRVFDALMASSEKDAAGPVIDPNDEEAPALSRVYKGSNIISTVVSPGYNSGYVLHLLKSARRRRSILSRILGPFISLLITPLLMIFAKSTSSAVQTILHTLFLPHPIKITFPSPSAKAPFAAAVDTRVLQGGRLYRDNAPVVLPAGAETALLGQEGVGRAVWEYYEARLKKWEEEEKAHAESVKSNSGTRSADSTPSSATKSKDT